MIRAVVKIGDEQVILFGTGDEDQIEVILKDGTTYRASRREVKETEKGTQKEDT